MGHFWVLNELVFNNKITKKLKIIILKKYVSFNKDKFTRKESASQSCQLTEN